jgi:hypothetical protein
VFDLVFESIVECRGDDVRITEFSFQDHFFKELCIPLDQACLFESSKETLSGLLLGVQVSLFKSEVLLEFFPDTQVVGGAVTIILSGLLH